RRRIGHRVWAIRQAPLSERIERYSFPSAARLSEPLTQPAHCPVMGDAGYKGLKLLNRFQTPHLLDERFQRFDGHILDFCREIRLELGLGGRESHGPEPVKCIVPRSSIVGLERAQVHGASLPQMAFASKSSLPAIEQRRAGLVQDSFVGGASSLRRKPIPPIIGRMKTLRVRLGKPVHSGGSWLRIRSTSVLSA